MTTKADLSTGATGGAGTQQVQHDFVTVFPPRTSALWGVAKVLRQHSATFLPSFSLGELIILSVFIIAQVLIIAVGATQANLFDAGVFLGQVSQGALFVCLLPIFKQGGLLLFFCNVSWERGIKYHRWLAVWATVCVCAHGGCFIVFWQTHRVFQPGDSEKTSVIDQMYSNKGQSQNVYGGAAAAIMIFICLSSYGYFRRSYFELWQKVHWLAFPFLVGMVALHYSGGTSVAVLCVPVGYHLLWQVHAYFTKRTVVIIDAKVLPGNVIYLAWDKGDWRYEAGQYVFLELPSKLRPTVSWGPLESAHPFSLSSSPHQPVVCLHVKIYGRFTRHLAKLATAGKLVGESICVKGPCGSLSLPIPSHGYFTKPTTLVFVSGGIGVTPMLSIFRSIVHNQLISRRGQNATTTATATTTTILSLPSCWTNAAWPCPRPQESQPAKVAPTRIRFLWSVREASEYTWFAKELEELAATDPLFEIIVYVTSKQLQSGTQLSRARNHQASAPAAAIPMAESTQRSLDVEAGVSASEQGLAMGPVQAPPSPSLPSSETIGIQRGRPDLKQIFDELVAEVKDSTTSDSETNVADVMALTCGPQALQQLCINLCTVSNRIQKQVVFHHHAETFEV